MLASEIVDRSYSNWLEPAGVDRPAIDFLANDITAAAPGPNGTFGVEGIQQFIPPSSILEIASELILTKDVTTNIVTVAERGYRDTLSADHFLGDQVRLDPKYPRKTMLDHLASVVGMLHPWGVKRYGTDTATAFSSRATLTLPTGADEIIAVSVRWTDTPERWETFTHDGKDWTLFEEFTPTKYQLLCPGAEGAEMVVSWTGDFELPDSEADELDGFGVPTRLQPYLPLAVAGMALQSREIPRVQIEEIRRMLATQGIQIGSALNVGQAMIQAFRTQYVMSERKRQLQKNPARLVLDRAR